MNRPTLKSRLILSLAAVAFSVAAAYLAIWLGLSGGSPLSSENTQFALIAGLILGAVSSIVINLTLFIKHRHILKISIGVLVGLPIIAGFVLMIWVAAVASI